MTWSRVFVARFPGVAVVSFSRSERGFCLWPGFPHFCLGATQPRNPLGQLLARSSGQALGWFYDLGFNVFLACHRLKCSSLLPGQTSAWFRRPWWPTRSGVILGYTGDFWSGPPGYSRWGNVWLCGGGRGRRRWRVGNGSDANVLIGITVCFVVWGLGSEGCVDITGAVCLGFGQLD